MDTKVDIHDLGAHLTIFMEQVVNGERVIITEAGKPVAVLSPIDAVLERRIPGVDKGKVIISADFDAPLPEFDLGE